MSSRKRSTWNTFYLLHHQRTFNHQITPH